MIALACDHHGVALKQELMKMLDEMGLAWKDFGTYDANNPGDDYPVYGYKAAQAVASGECDRGILLCGTGMGISIVACKVRGIRVCTCSDVSSAEVMAISGVMLSPAWTLSGKDRNISYRLPLEAP